MMPAPTIVYRCTLCEADWTYEAVRHVARCRACGGSLRRREDPPAPSTAPVRRGKRVRRRSELAYPG
ncbi:MAG: hypothetical protein ACLP0L_08285 [Solirubrobacteraceae bacterium]